MSSILKEYGKAFVVFIALDFVWLTRISPAFYAKHISHLLAPQPSLVAAAAFYFIFIAGLLNFAILPAKQGKSRGKAFIRGAFFGLVTYATFDLTSQAVFRDWPMIVTIVDLAWGSFLCGLTTLVCTHLSFTRS